MSEERENTSEAMLTDMAEQFKQKFEENEKIVNKLKREKIETSMELISLFGLISAIDNLVHETNAPPELQILSELTFSKCEEWVRIVLSSKEEPIVLSDMSLNIEILPELNISE